jgi:hypothetical protein
VLEIRWTGPPGWGLGDRPTTCHCTKLIVRKPKMWPQNRQTERSPFRREGSHLTVVLFKERRCMYVYMYVSTYVMLGFL